MKRLELLNGKYTMPRIIDMQSKDARVYRELQLMYSAMWNAYLTKGCKGSISLPYWAQRIKSPKLMNIALKLLSEKGYITVTTQPHRNWSEASLNEDKILSYVDKAELISIRKHFKWSKYLLTSTEVNEEDATLTRINGTVKNTGLHRPGFTKASKTKFQFDTATMQEHYSEVVQLVNMGIESTLAKYPALREDLVNYSEVGKEVVDTYLHIDGTYNSGGRKSDSRGRNIQGYLNKIGNPVGYKIMRSLLVIPEENRQQATRKGLLAKYLFIAELNGYKVGTVFGKIRYGINCYHNRTLHTLDLTNSDDLKELPDNIWLERLYKDIDAYYMNIKHKWTVPIELDMSASVLGFYGILLNHQPYMNRCNMVGNTLNDAWGHHTIKNRAQFKTIMRQLYGSQATPQAMWDDMKIPYTHEEAVAFTKELLDGEMSVANIFKNFMINNAQMQPTMELNVWGEKFVVECNRFFNQGEQTISYDLYDSHSKSIKRIHHTDTIKVPNLQAFRRYVATALIHHLDSRAMDTTCNAVYDQYQWVLDIHDAAIVDAEAAKLVRIVYANQLERIHTDRKFILQDYFRSVNIPAMAITEWKEVMSKVTPLNGPFKCNKMVLK